MISMITKTYQNLLTTEPIQSFIMIISENLEVTMINSIRWNSRNKKIIKRNSKSKIFKVRFPKVLLVLTMKVAILKIEAKIKNK